jgi:hypothetical protein
MSLLYALTGSFDKPGGNVLLPAAPAAPITGEELPSAKSMGPTLGLAERPLGPARWKYYTTRDLYRAIREGSPTRCAQWSASARTCCWPTLTAELGARRS